MANQSETTPYPLHQAALRPLLDRSLDRDNLLIKNTPPESAARFLYHQRVNALWLDLLDSTNTANEYAELHEELKKLTHYQVGKELPQQRIMSEAHELLTQADIPYFFAKGAHLRAVYYQPSHLRPAIDVDLFVPCDRQKEAIYVFENAGYRSRPNADTLSHELKLSKHNADIDLHWHLFRPGRARPGLMNWLLERREKFGDYWGLDPTANLLVMLVHPAITKYLISPTSMLVHQVDQVRLIQSGQVDWGELEEVLRWSGMRTAAWSSVYLLRKLAEGGAPDGFENSIRPNGAHTTYLRLWIDHGWVTNWFEKGWVVAGFFSLALQDSMSDSVRALKFRMTAL